MYSDKKNSSSIQHEVQSDSEVKALRMIHKGYGMRITSIEEKLLQLERIATESTQSITITLCCIINWIIIDKL